ncbi:hypothetical protein CH063_12750 [Colletotrichum higginsianum]|uniref:Putative Extracellular dioxygenase n=1 Tax=Colletotrichum higginsianum (strain IMI 349063) TaxID=759273 RepID=H1VRM7_COLHI|nr:putative Extracellular dioxygenase [Colletotrichum higginsianum IMI 349063]OBR06736.1 putative Extracellular dioxygenase [Colletotrichum higginsianum IMI 349063]CCF42883.1 hypothetical protein CH063_12750 [Colletotrichum higginsianum]
METQTGIPLVLELQFINTRTCRPIGDLFVEIWHANASGVYSVVANIDNRNSLSTLQGNEEGSGERTMIGRIIDESWLRGVQQTGANRVVRFKTIMPGWYLGDSGNGTLASSFPANHSVQASHVGQTFFDSNLLDHVAAIHPYKSNPQWRNKNDEDAVLTQESNTSEPMVQYMMMGNGIEEGLLGWIVIGIGPEVNVRRAASWYGTWGRMWRKMWY